MELSLREAATLLGRSPRTLRDQLSRGALPGTKHDGRWILKRADLPLTDAQRHALERRVGEVRRAMDETLRPYEQRVAAGRKSVRELEVFRLALELRDRLRRAAASAAPPALAERAERQIELGILFLCEGVHHFDRDWKVRALRRARVRWSRAVGWLLLVSEPSPELRWCAERLEERVLPSLSGLLRWAERLGRKAKERPA